MPRALVITHLRENYGAHSWNGEGACPQYWKNKGNYEYVVELPAQHADCQEILDSLAKAVAYANNHASEHVLSRRILADGEKSPDEAHFEDLLAQGIANESDRKAHTPAVMTLDAVRAAVLGHNTTEEPDHVDA